MRRQSSVYFRLCFRRAPAAQSVPPFAAIVGKDERAFRGRVLALKPSLPAEASFIWTPFARYSPQPGCASECGERATVTD